MPACRQAGNSHKNFLRQKMKIARKFLGHISKEN
jgi:hypothetical protein